MFILLSFFAISADAQESRVVKKPTWAVEMKPPMRTGQKCFIGSSPTSKDSNQALSDAYKNALFNVIEREFPSLISIRSQSSERLDGSAYSRETAYKSENLRFEGLNEDKESPYIELTGSGGDLKAFRLLCWTQEAIESEKRRQREVSASQRMVISNSSESVLPPNKKSGPTGKLEVTSVPPGATILLEAHSIGQTNARFERVIAGTYELVVQKEGYEIESKVVNIVAGRLAKENFELRKQTSKILIKTEPAGASVYQDNKPIDGGTPVVIEAVVGDELDLRLEMAEFHTEKRKISISSRNRPLEIQLKPRDATLSVLSTPSKADVYVDGARVGFTPLIGYSIEGGRHQIVVSAEGYESFRQDIDVWQSRPLTLKPKLKPFETEVEENMGRAQERKSMKPQSKSNLALSAKSMEEDKCPPDSGNSCNRSMKETRELLYSECENANLDACVGFGILLVKGRGGERNEIKARQIFQLACDGNIAKGCLYLGQMWEDGRGGRRHRPVAEQMFERARALLQGFCQDGDPDSCFELGVLWRQGKGGDKDSTKSNFYFQQSCNLGRKQSCAQFLKE